MIGRAIGLGGRRALVLVLWNMARTRMDCHRMKSMMWPYKSAMVEYLVIQFRKYVGFMGAFIRGNNYYF
jgi:hypothetical protein